MTDGKPRTDLSTWNVNDLGNESNFAERSTSRLSVEFPITDTLIYVAEYFNCRETNRKSEYMGENNFGLPQDVISVGCTSKYFGNIPPKLTCEWSSGAQTFDNHQYVTEANVTTTLNIQVPARKEFNGDQLSCYADIDGESSGNQTSTVWMSSHLIINCKYCHGS